LFTSAGNTFGHPASLHAIGVGAIPYPRLVSNFQTFFSQRAYSKVMKVEPFSSDGNFYFILFYFFFFFHPMFI